MNLSPFSVVIGPMRSVDTTISSVVGDSIVVGKVKSDVISTSVGLMRLGVV